MDQEIERIAANNQVTVEWRESTRARAWRKGRFVRLQRIKNMEHFAVALHELGHVIGKQTGARLQREYQAWQWAVDNTPLPFDSSAWLKLHECLRSYVTWAKARQHRKNVKPVIPPQDHPLWALLAQAKSNF